MRRIKTITEDFLLKNELKSISGKTVSVLLVSLLSLVFIRYFSNIHDAAELLKSVGFEGVDNIRNESVKAGNIKYIGKIYWALVNTFFYFFLPLVFILFVYKEPLRDYGFKNFFKVKGAYKIYFIFLVIMIPLVYLMAQQEAFIKKYPFFSPTQGESLWPEFYIWQFVYFLQFIGLEFFFRGFMIHGLKKTFGYYSIFIMVVPYCMIHFAKPFPETLGAIIAGIVLGYLSYKKGSIALGIAIHYSIAICMDLFALANKI